MNFTTLKKDLMPSLPCRSIIDPKTVVDDIFCIIESDSVLVNLYKHNWGASSCNAIVSKFIKSHYKLANVSKAGVPQKNIKPRSALIQGYQVFH